MARTPRLAAVLLLVVLLLVQGGPSLLAGGAGTRSERKMFDFVNETRSKKGISQLDLRAGLTRKAHKHSRRMAANGHLSHQPSSAYPDDATWGENVAQARTVRRAHKLLMRSPSHRQKILCGCFERIGVGVVHRNGWFWVTEMFVG